MSVPNPSPVRGPSIGYKVQQRANQGQERATVSLERVLDMWVPGDPAPQGSKKGFVTKSGKVSLVESSRKVAPWRTDIRNQILTNYTGSIVLGAVYVRVDFILYRPVATAKTRATPHAIKKPDLDKLERAILDAITSSGFWKDDSQVVRLLGTKRIAEIDEATGVRIRVDRVIE